VAREAMLVPALATPKLSRVVMIMAEIVSLFFLSPVFILQYEYRLS
jgi:hypothetical protein